jgi:hypothetical protein
MQKRCIFVRSIRHNNKTNAMKTINYKGFEITETTQDGGATTAVAYFNGSLMFGTFSHLDALSAIDKMIVKIDNYLKK